MRRCWKAPSRIWLTDCIVEVHVGKGLEKYGGAVAKLLECLPEGYHFLAAPENGTFLPLRENGEVQKARFFLLAIHSESSAVS
jgi:hypothetical protein